MLVAVITMFVVVILPSMSTAETATTFCTVRLRAQASVKNASPNLGDIADLSGNDGNLVAQLSHMPLGSITDVLLLSRSEIAALIRKAGVNPAEIALTGAEFTRVSLATRMPSAAEISAVLKPYLASVTQWREDEIEALSIDNLSAIELPQGEMQLRVLSRGVPSSFRSLLLSFEASQNGKPVRTFWVKAEARIRAQVVCVARPVTYKGVLAEGDLREQTCDIEDPRLQYFRTPAEAVGKVARRSLRQGELLSRNSVEEAGLVNAGEIVRLTVESRSVRMIALARALQGGKLGDPIKLRNVDTDRVITAVVTGRREARIAN